MKPLGAINQRAVDISLYRGFSVFEFGQDGPDVRLLNSDVSPAPHAARDDDLTIPHGVKHLCVFVRRMRTQPMPVFVIMVMMFGFDLHELLMPGLVPLFFADDFAIFDGEDEIIRRATKMTADGRAAVDDYSNFHCLFPFIN